jgi:hypothetical protein
VSAIGALVHRMNGALNNASMAFELALGSARAEDKAAELLRGGLAAIGQASRAAALLAHLVHGRGVPPGDDAAYRRDVQEIVRARAGESGASDQERVLDAEPSPAEAAEWLVAEFTRMHAGGR